MAMRTWKTVSFVNRDTPAAITTELIDLEECYKEDEVVVEVYSSALNAIDAVLHHAAVPSLSSSKPKGYGKDFAGIIIKKGRSVSDNWSIGDKVNGMLVTLYAKHSTVSNYLILNPDKMESICHLVTALTTTDNKFNEFDMAASWPVVFTTACGAIFNPGRDWNKIDRVLIIGASTQVANCMVQILKNHLNVHTVVGICNERSIEGNKSLGFDHLVSYNGGKTLSNVRDLMQTKLNGKKFNVILDSCGSKDFLPIMSEFLTPRNTNSYYSTVVGDSFLSYTNTSTIQLLKERLLIEPYRRFNPFRSYNYYFNVATPTRKNLELANTLISSGKFQPLIDSVYAFEDFQDAIDKMNTELCKGKIIIQVKRP